MTFCQNLVRKFPALHKADSFVSIGSYSNTIASSNLAIASERKSRQSLRVVESAMITLLLLQRVRVDSSIILQRSGPNVVVYLLVLISVSEILLLLWSSVLGENFPNTPPCRIQSPRDPGVMAAGSFTTEMKVSIRSWLGYFRVKVAELPRSEKCVSTHGITVMVPVVRIVFKCLVPIPAWGPTMELGQVIIYLIEEEFLRSRRR
jgi:hypothetical protein